MDNINDIVAANLVKLRKKHKLTQMELAEKIHYSDKSISKWETGESCPGIAVACRIADFYGITLDDLVRESLNVEEAPVFRHSHIAITLLGGSVVWLVATILFVYGVLLGSPMPWIRFIDAVPATCAVALVFNTLFGNRRLNYWILSVFTWTFLTSVYFFFFKGGMNVWVIFCLGIPIQICLILWSRLKRRVPYPAFRTPQDGE